MTGAGTLLTLNLALAGTFAVLFAVVALLDRTRPAPRWLSAGLALAMVYSIGEWIIAGGTAPLLGHMLAGVGYVAALSAIAIGIGHHYGVRVEPRVLLLLVVLSVPLYLVLYGLPRDSIVRQVAYQVPFLVAQGTAVAVAAIAAPRRGWLDRLLAVVLALNFLNTAAKPLLAKFSGGVGAQATDYVNSAYAVLSQGSGSVLAFLVALLLKLILTRDVVLNALARIRQDAETGFLGLWTFESRVLAALEQNKGPQALTMVRLEPISTPELTAAAIERLVSALRAASPPWAVPARIDGGTFAILDPKANIIVAQKAMRYVISEGGGPGVLVSIGIAETEPGDVPATILARARVALEQARAAGGNCVRLAPRSHMTVEKRPED